MDQRIAWPAAMLGVLFVLPVGGVAGSALTEPGALDVPTWLAMAAAGTLPSECPLAGLATVQRDLPPPQAAIAAGVGPRNDGGTTADECGGLRPGAQLSTGCTMNFVFTDGVDLFIGTAGHCTSQGVPNSAPGVGSFGTTVFSINAGLGNDFALIRVDASKRSLVNPTMCTWGGPLGLSSGQLPLGEIIHEYGWGLATFPVAQTRGRVHLLLAQDATSVTWLGIGSGGDSGAPLTDSQDRALALHTHGITPLVGVVGESGTTVARGLALAAAAGWTVTLVPGAADPSDPLPFDSPHRSLFAAGG